VRVFVEVSKVHDISVLHLFGEISFMELGHIERVIQSLQRCQNKKIILDFASVDHIHYRIIKNLVEQAQNLRFENGDLKIVGANEETRQILKFTGADQYLDDYATISEGILSFLQPKSDNGYLQ